MAWLFFLMFDCYLHHGSFEAFYKVGWIIPLGLELIIKVFYDPNLLPVWGESLRARALEGWFYIKLV